MLCADAHGWIASSPLNQGLQSIFNEMAREILSLQARANFLDCNVWIALQRNEPHRVTSVAQANMPVDNSVAKFG